MSRPAGVRWTRRLRASGPGSEVTSPAPRIWVTDWLIAEWLTPHSSASRLIVIGPAVSRNIRAMLNRGRTPWTPSVS